MYIRFVVSEWDTWARAEVGFFGTAYDIKYQEQPTDAWIRDQVTRELDWFKENLPVPDRLNRRAGRFGRVHGVCWFDPAAAEAISRARYVAWLLTEAGRPVLELRRRKPGEIIWRDPMQVVAKPPRDHPRLFH